jgi:glyoxylase-like metal-dependent hydrolase (beta-lactamase superfamily II)
MTASEVAPRVWRAGTRFVNWYVVDAGDEGVTVVDAGLPDYGRDFERVLSSIGVQPSDVRGVVLTHGHVDHVGGAAAAAALGAPIYLHPDDTELARNPRSNQTEAPLAGYLRWPSTWAFLAHCVARGALRPPRLPALLPLEEGTLHGVPGTPPAAACCTSASTGSPWSATSSAR